MRRKRAMNRTRIGICLLFIPVFSLLFRVVRNKEGEVHEVYSFLCKAQSITNIPKSHLYIGNNQINEDANLALGMQWCICRNGRSLKKQD